MERSGLSENSNKGIHNNERKEERERERRRGKAIRSVIEHCDQAAQSKLVYEPVQEEIKCVSTYISVSIHFY
jgi:hypothetical protein